MLDAVAALPYLVAEGRQRPRDHTGRDDMADKTLDARHLRCPLPIMKTKRAIGTVEIGATLEVLATDPGSPDDFTAFAEATGHSLVSSEAIGDGVFRFVLRRQH